MVLRRLRWGAVALGVSSLPLACATFLGLDDVEYHAVDASAGDGTVEASRLDDAATDAGDAGAEAGRFCLDQAIMPSFCMDFDEEAGVLGGYRLTRDLVQVASAPQGAPLWLDTDASVSPPASMLAWSDALLDAAVDASQGAYFVAPLGTGLLAVGGELSLRIDTSPPSGPGVHLIAFTFDSVSFIALAAGPADTTGAIPIFLLALHRTQGYSRQALFAKRMRLGEWAHARFGVGPLPDGGSGGGVVVELTTSTGSEGQLLPIAVEPDPAVVVGPHFFDGPTSAPWLVRYDNIGIWLDSIPDAGTDASIKDAAGGG